MSESPKVWVETRHEPAAMWSRWFRDDRTVYYVRTASMTWGPFADEIVACERADELTQALRMSPSKGREATIMNMSDEPEIIINGTRLTNAQAMAVRVAVSAFDADCGDDEHGRAMTKAYTDRLNEVFRIMLGKSAIVNGD